MFKQNIFSKETIVPNQTPLDRDVEEKLCAYARLLSEGNARARLTGPSDPGTIYEEHILDCLYALPFLEGAESFIDVGTGGGLPGLVFGICLPNSRGVLIDSVGKKVKIVADIASQLGCSNIEVQHVRSEEYAQETREHFSVATARAVTSAPVLAEYLSPFVKTGGRIVAFKGRNAESEIEPARARWETLGLSEPRLYPYTHKEKSRFIVVWTKIKNARLASRASR
ncbi:16S rRNA (guanine(527)-N(7))-methyltransferase RsmG, partial [Synergistaceae bacterium OttesenSCG-928-I11]|nr:16S rRNA (guanine(527)-N(7))-methyltransferase RsmG [Synergistaceae bacterium OttesenSCG-928-I11]